MEKFMKILEGINWQMVLYVTIQIIIVLAITWVLLWIAAMVLRRLEQTLIHRGPAEGEVPTESAKRVSTLIRLLRQGVTIVVMLMAGLVRRRDVGSDI